MKDEVEKQKFRQAIIERAKHKKSLRIGSASDF